MNLLSSINLRGAAALLAAAAVVLASGSGAVPRLGAQPVPEARRSGMRGNDVVVNFGVFPFHRVNGDLRVNGDYVSAIVYPRSNARRSEAASPPDGSSQSGFEERRAMADVVGGDFLLGGRGSSLVLRLGQSVVDTVVLHVVGSLVLGPEEMPVLRLDVRNARLEPGQIVLMIHAAEIQGTFAGLDDKGQFHGDGYVYRLEQRPKGIVVRIVSVDTALQEHRRKLAREGYFLNPSVTYPLDFRD